MPSDEKILQTSHGWSDWSGGNPPSKNWRALVDTEQRSGRICKSVRVGAFDWGWTYGKYNHWDIIRFRFVTDEDTLERKKAQDHEMGKTPNERIAEARGHGGASDDSSFDDSVMKENFEAKHGDSSGGSSSRGKAGNHKITNPDRVIAVTNEGRTIITQQRGALGVSPQKHRSRGPHKRS